MHSALINAKAAAESRLALADLFTCLSNQLCVHGAIMRFALQTSMPFAFYPNAKCIVMSEMHKRLATARKEAGFQTVRQAAGALGVHEITYAQHENGRRGFKRDAAELYSRKFGVSLEWLLTNRGPKERRSVRSSEAQRHVNLVGYVGAGAETHFFANDEPLDEVPAPDNTTDSTVAVEIRGESLGSFFDRWLVFYDDVRRPVTGDLINKLCVVGLEDGRILIKKIQRSKAKGLFHLLSQTEGPILDVKLEWAAKVKVMVPR